MKSEVDAASHINRKDADILAERYGVTSRVVIAKAAAAGKYDAKLEPSGLPQPGIAGRVTHSRKRGEASQYGVLQPAANLGAGCLQQWLWLIVIGAVLVAVAVVVQQFS